MRKKETPSQDWFLLRQWITGITILIRLLDTILYHYNGENVWSRILASNSIICDRMKWSWLYGSRIVLSLRENKVFGLYPLLYPLLKLPVVSKFIQQNVEYQKI